jgi:AhpC/TSA family protein
MRKHLLNRVAGGLLAAALTASSLGAPLWAQEKQKPAPPKLKVGEMAPEFKLQYFDGSDLKDVSLSQYRGKKNVVLAFYIFAFTGG